MNQYQLTLVVDNNLDEKARKELFSTVTKNFGNLKKEDLWGQKSLAYPIKHQQKAFYAYFEFESEPNTIPSLDKMIKLNEDIIRYLLIKSKIKKQKSKMSEKNKQEEVRTEAGN